MNVSNVVALKWVCQAANQLHAERPPYDAAGGRIMEIDEMWHYIGKNRSIWLWMAADRDSRNIVGCRVGSRGRKTLKNLFFYNNLNALRYATDDFLPYRGYPKNDGFVSKAHTVTIESKNNQIRHYLTRFH